MDLSNCDLNKTTDNWYELRDKEDSKFFSEKIE